MTQTEVRFVSGHGRYDIVPPYLKAARTAHRFAVVQETYRPDKVDMYFDLALWLCLLRFAEQYSPSARVKIVRDDAREIDADRLLKESRESIECPPGDIVVREGHAVLLSIVPEFWNRVGGPYPFHDSYTYGIYSNEDLGSRLVQYLRDSDTADQWDISSEVLPPIPVRRTIWEWVIETLGS